MADTLDKSKRLLDNIQANTRRIKGGLKSPQSIPGAREPEPPPPPETVGPSKEEDLDIDELFGASAPGAETEKPEENLEDLDLDLDLGEDEELSGEPEKAQEDAKEEEVEVEPESDILDAPEKPKERVWEPVKPVDDNMKNLSFRSDKESIFIDMQRLDQANRLWIARLHKDGKLLDYGQVIIPPNVKDPITFVLELANTMLDHKTMRYEQEWQEYYASKRKKEEPEESEGTEETEGTAGLIPGPKEMGMGTL